MPKLVVNFDNGQSLEEVKNQVEAFMIECALAACGNSTTKAAKRLDISRIWLNNRRKKHGIAKS